MPDVSLAGLEGKTYAFRKGSSDLTLVEFWNTNGGPCREEMPLAEFSIAWPECLERDSGPVLQIMRIEGIPAYFLAARNGETHPEGARRHPS